MINPSNILLPPSSGVHSDRSLAQSTVRLRSPTTVNGSTPLTDHSQRFDSAHRPPSTLYKIQPWLNTSFPYESKVHQKNTDMT
ncbi:hypothetical protein [Anabaenopsis elenkinii]|uniref:Uncharacterized protein n=1 Tax=Anabaenopsis elenkinii CCIBt3563 TaxID=2779889 RepID=A0A7S6RFJ7_9CYAN|nr:hypothetical protein [Anabaenopsis elenkinii]QOV23991.1 hypothetical protein IM676_06890 [Anabaenopsis elenkinii CCIBt3563]